MAPTEIYTLSLHDALPIFAQNLALDVHVPLLKTRRIRHVVIERLALRDLGGCGIRRREHRRRDERDRQSHLDRKSTRLNSSHVEISYAVFCLKKKKKII